MMNKYDEALPVDEGWAQEHEGEQWTFTMLVGLDDLIECDGIDGMNNMCDEITGVVLSDITYRVGAPGDGDEISDLSVIVETTGTVERF